VRRRKALQQSVGLLQQRVGELEQELRQRASALPESTAGWQGPEAEEADEPGLPHAWLSILEPPVRGSIRIPRLPFEVLFLAGCAAGAGIADLEARWIAAVMAGAWLLVSLTEWSASRADRRRAERSTIAPPQLVPARAGKPDAAWYIPPVEQTMMEGAMPAAGEATAVTRLGLKAPVPNPASAEPPPDLEQTVAGQTTAGR
jgi:hypothetical protein